ncbi:MAG: hypothetical protein KJ927_15180, partial [Candidatus Eisenbacteria bacterium]|nr:hypothetical protein [Candidatus Eisenbacteria bacterium]
MKYRIGKTISVLGDSVSVLLEDYSEDSGECRGVPEGMCIDIQNEEGPLSLIVGQPGSFVDVSIPTGSLICIVTAVKMTELAWTSGEVTEAGKDEEYLIDTSKRILEVIAIGTIKADGSFERGSDVLPTVGADVFAVSPDSIKNM